MVGVKDTAWRVLCVVVAVAIAWGLAPLPSGGAAGRAYAAQYATGNSEVAGFDVSSDGEAITIDFTGQSWYIQQDALTFYFADGSSSTYKVIVGNNPPSCTLKTTGWTDVSGVEGDATFDSDKFNATLVIPLAALSGSGDFTMTFFGTSVTSQQMGLSSGGAGSGTGGDSDGGNSGGSGTDGSDGGDTPGSTDGGSGTGAGTGGSGAGGSDSGTANPVDISTLEPTTAGRIAVDGANEDWTCIGALSSNDSYVAEWKLARDASGNVYLMLDGTVSTQWDYNFEWYQFKFMQNGAEASIPVKWLADQTGATVEYKNYANHNTPAPYVVEAMIPAGYFTDANATIEFVGKTVAVDDIPVVNGEDTTPDAPTTYEGIVIDGAFSDWAPVTKYPANDANGELDQVAMVWDGDTVYLYIAEMPGTLGAYHAGTHGNGKYEIITDLDERLVFELNYDGTVSGPAGATASHVGNQWEIAIPASNLPSYLNTISFGMYQTDEEMISGVSNLSGQGSGGTFAGIVYDGLYGDWEYYPHHIIQYATAGTQENVEDARGALYAEDGILYGHVFTNMQQHLDNSNGREFTSGVTIRFNDETSLDFYPMSTTVDANGNINWWPQLEGLANGTYEFYIMSRDAWHTSQNVSNLNEHDTVFGKMTVTISDDKDECEFYLDLATVADKLGVNENDFKTIAAQFINIGNEWITCAGTSTAPFVGIGLGVATVAGVLGYRRWKGVPLSARR